MELDEMKFKEMDSDEIVRWLTVAGGGALIYYALKRGSLFSLLLSFVGEKLIRGGISKSSKFREKLSQAKSDL